MNAIFEIMPSTFRSPTSNICVVRKNDIFLIIYTSRNSNIFVVHKNDISLIVYYNEIGVYPDYIKDECCIDRFLFVQSILV